VKTAVGVKAHGSQISDVLQGCHREIIDHLDKLVALVSAQQSATPTEECRSRAREIITFFCGPARAHNYDEEQHVFPVLRQCGDAGIRQIAEDLCEDHAWIELYWLDIEPQLQAIADGVRPHQARDLRAATETFVATTRNHMRLEESLLFPELRNRLTPAELRSIERRMAARIASAPAK